MMNNEQKAAGSASARNKYCFGMGTIGRDMFYSMVSMFLLVYLTEVLDLSDSIMWWITGVFTTLRVFDALNDPIMGLIVDNTMTRWGKFKPWILFGEIVGGVAMILLFTDLGLTGAAYIVVFALLYIFWDIFFGANDTAYWSMMPSLSLDQKERERIGAFARICANVGLFTVVVATLPVTNALGNVMGLKSAWSLYAVIVTALMFLFSLTTLLGVKEDRDWFKPEEPTGLRELFRIIFKNDQLLFVAIAMMLFSVGYMTTTSFGVYFFKYAFGDENKYSVFAAVLGVSQIAALVIFPLFSKRFSRKTLYTAATALVIAGDILFFCAPMNMLPLGIAGVLIFVGDGFIQLLMLMFLADTIEYGQWKFGKRNQSITFSMQPLINKLGGALASGVVGVTLILSGINSAATPADVTPEGITLMKSAMMILPLAVICLGYVIYLFKYRLDEKTYTKILEDLRNRGDILG
ncbi:MAG: glycoside-pentoside-hexuronide (GPH):cation symporter [Treponema sp.]|jgi:melibiose permease/lactose/raffinose/galactose permease|nr:glycoside-pentoside-hexuronide (GPH):cation symporter [Treponema sp.]